MRWIGLAVVLALCLLALGLALGPLAVEAQPTGKVWRIDVLELDTASNLLDPLREGLRQLGYVLRWLISLLNQKWVH
jgi:hypothetical protein